MLLTYPSRKNRLPHLPPPPPLPSSSSRLLRELSSENNLSSFSLEKLDHFCNEGNVKKVVEILGLLEKQHVHVDLHLYLQLMQACGEAKAIQEAKIVHDSYNSFVGGSMVNMLEPQLLLASPTN
ncbi:hypothetical protein ACFX1Q_046099 [Malus domestica]